MKTSALYSLNLKDIGKAAIIAALTPALVLAQTTIDSGSLVFNWKQLGMAALAGFIGYLIKNFFTPAQIVEKVK